MGFSNNIRFLYRRSGKYCTCLSMQNSCLLILKIFQLIQKLTLLASSCHVYYLVSSVLSYVFSQYCALTEHRVGDQSLPDTAVSMEVDSGIQTQLGTATSSLNTASAPGASPATAAASVVSEDIKVKSPIVITIKQVRAITIYL